MVAVVDTALIARAAALRVKRRHTPPSPRVPLAWETDWHSWLAEVFPSLVHFAPHHEQFWRWVWALQPGVRPRPFIGIWPRGGGKSSSAELATVAIGATNRRKYGLYVSGTQQQAEKHLLSIEALLGAPGIAQRYPAMTNRDINKYGSSRGWRRDRLVTASGFVIDAVGLRTGTRGVKFEDQRPDFIVFDDVDELDDTDETTQKKIDTLTQTLLPAGATDLATLGIQNLVIPNGLFARLSPDAEDPADFLRGREVSGPVPAVEDLEYEERVDEDGAFRAFITSGTPTWSGQDLETAAQQMNDWGVDAFLSEAQHMTRVRGARIFQREWWQDRSRYSVHDTALMSRAIGRFMCWDTAESLSSAAAYSACIVGDLMPYRNGYALLIRDAWRDRMEQPALQDAILQRAQHWDLHIERRDFVKGVVVEYASSGKAAIQTAKLNAPTWLRSLLHKFPPIGSKDDRGVMAAVYCRAGRVWLPAPDPAVPWLAMFEQELYSVPNATYRDMTDAFSELILYLRNYVREPGQQHQDSSHAAAD